MVVSGATNVISNATISDRTQVRGISIHVGRTTSLVDSGVERLVVMELDVVGLGGVGLWARAHNLFLDRFFCHLLLLGNSGDDAFDELLERNLALTLRLDLVENQIDVSGGKGLVDESALLAHLSEVAVVHILGRGGAVGGEGYKDVLKRHGVQIGVLWG